MEFSQNFSVNEVVSFLKEKILVTSEIEHMIQKEQINGQTLLDLNDSDLRTLGFSTIRAVKEMQRLIMQCKNEANGPSVMLCLEEPPFANLHGKILQFSGGCDVIGHLNENGYLRRRDQKIFTNICVEILVSEAVKRGYKKNYPPSALKVDLAKSIVEEFPKLKLKLEGTTGYGHYYDPLRGSGFIENKLKTLRKQMAIEDKMYKKQKRSGSTVELDASLLEDDSPILKKIKWLKETTPNKDNKAEIYNIMKESHDYRRLEIQLKPMTLTDILEKYPRFCDAYEGGLIDCEFEMNYPECKKFMEIFPPLIQKILKMDQDCVQCDDDGLKSLLVLSKILPPLNTKGRKGQEQWALFKFQGAGCNVGYYAETRPPSLRQPFLLVIGPKSHPEEFFLILDKKVVPVGNSSLLAFYRLFASFWIFGIEYYEKLATFFNFFEAILFGMDPKPSVASLLAALDFV
ncbi:uncharacterized protein LOC120334474 isoform X2 [Styela clava]